jgi:hypothetical protein
LLAAVSHQAKPTWRERWTPRLTVSTPRHRSRLGLVEESVGFHEGQKVWVIVRDGSQRPAIYVGEGENASWFGGPPLAYVVFADDRSGAEVQLDMIVPRDE